MDSWRSTAVPQTPRPRPPRDPPGGGRESGASGGGAAMHGAPPEGGGAGGRGKDPLVVEGGVFERSPMLSFRVRCGKAGYRPHVGQGGREEALMVAEAAIEAAAAIEAVVIPLLHDPALVEDEDPVQRAHRREAVGDHDRGAPLHQPLHRLLDQRLRLRVEARGRLVQDQDRRIGQEGAGHGHALALAARQLHAALAHQGAVALGQAHDEVVRIGEPRRALDLRHASRRAAHRRCSRPACGGTGSAPAARWRSATAGTPASPRRCPARRSDPPARHVVEPLDQLDEGRLAGARRPDEADRSPARIVSDDPGRAAWRARA